MQENCEILYDSFSFLDRLTYNIYYVYVLKDYFETTSMALAVMRSFSAIPAHALFGAFMGYYFMKYAFISKKNNLFLCFFIPFLLH